MSNYALEGPKWASSVITWSFASAGGSFSGAIGAPYQATIIAAISRWAQVANITLQQVSDSTPGVDVRIGWGVFSGGQVGETDYSYQSGASMLFTPGTVIRLQDPSAVPVGTSLSSAYQGTATTLFQTAMHEFGHALGLNHSTDPNAIMYPYLGTSDLNLDASDIAGIDSIYGAYSVAAMQTSAPTPTLPPAVVLPGDDVAVYRFFDKLTGTQFLTGDTAERNTLITTRPDLAYEGVGMAGVAADGSDPNAAPVYRFFDTRNGTHLFTTSKDEVNTITQTRPDLVAEANSFDEHLTAQPGDGAVYRFFESTDGTHFFTASNSERASIAATRPDMVYEGIAFYAPTTT